MATGVKISILGAGSAVFSLGLVKDLCLAEGLEGSHVCFMDIDEERLDMIHRVGSRYAEELGAHLTFEVASSRDAALADADFVIDTARVKDEYHALHVRTTVDQHGY